MGQRFRAPATTPVLSFHLSQHIVRGQGSGGSPQCDVLCAPRPESLTLRGRHLPVVRRAVLTFALVVLLTVRLAPPSHVFSVLRWMLFAPSALVLAIAFGVVLSPAFCLSRDLVSIGVLPRSIASQDRLLVILVALRGVLAAAFLTVRSEAAVVATEVLRGCRKFLAALRTLFGQFRHFASQNLIVHIIAGWRAYGKPSFAARLVT